MKSSTVKQLHFNFVILNYIPVWTSDMWSTKNWLSFTQRDSSLILMWIINVLVYKERNNYSHYSYHKQQKRMMEPIGCNPLRFEHEASFSLNSNSISLTQQSKKPGPARDRSSSPASFPILIISSSAYGPFLDVSSTEIKSKVKNIVIVELTVEKQSHIFKWGNFHLWFHLGRPQAL